MSTQETKARIPAPWWLFTLDEGQRLDVFQLYKASRAIEQVASISAKFAKDSLNIIGSDEGVLFDCTICHMQTHAINAIRARGVEHTESCVVGRLTAALDEIAMLILIGAEERAYADLTPREAEVLYAVGFSFWYWRLKGKRRHAETLANSMYEEPWIVATNQFTAPCWASVFSRLEKSVASPTYCASDRDLAMLRRIAVAVNFCAGIPDEMLANARPLVERGDWIDVVERMRAAGRMGPAAKAVAHEGV